MKLKPIAIGREQYVSKKTGEVVRLFTLVVQDGEKLTGFTLSDPETLPIVGIECEVSLADGFPIRRPFNR